jgi:chaperonin cofactor prefoldin
MRETKPLTMKSLDVDLRAHREVSDIRHDTLNERIAALEEQLTALQQAVGELVARGAAPARTMNKCRIFADGRMHCCD